MGYFHTVRVIIIYHIIIFCKIESNIEIWPFGRLKGLAKFFFSEGGRGRGGLRPGEGRIQVFDLVSDRRKCQLPDAFYPRAQYSCCNFWKKLRSCNSPISQKLRQSCGNFSKSCGNFSESCGKVAVYIIKVAVSCGF